MDRKLTVVYSVFFQTGSHRHSTVEHIHLTLGYDLSLARALEKEDIDPTQVNFIFEGHCQPIAW